MDTLNIIGKNLSNLKLKLEVISNNIANLNTPNYKRKDIVFDDIFNDIKLKMKITHPGHKEGSVSYVSTKKVVIDNTFPERADGNNVILEKEVKELNEVQVFYQSLIKMLNYILRGRKIVIGGR